MSTSRPPSCSAEGHLPDGKARLDSLFIGNILGLYRENGQEHGNYRGYRDSVSDCLSFRFCQ